MTFVERPVHVGLLNDLMPSSEIIVGKSVTSSVIMCVVYVYYVFTMFKAHSDFVRTVPRGHTRTVPYGTARDRTVPYGTARIRVDPCGYRSKLWQH